MKYEDTLKNQFDIYINKIINERAKCIGYVPYNHAVLLLVGNTIEAIILP